MNKILKGNKNFDLEERTTVFAESVINMCKGIKKSTVTLPIISQLIRSATAIGANYCEANGASSKRDFRSKIYICKKEAKETKYWLRLLGNTEESTKKDCRDNWKEAQELTLIFSKIAINSK